MTDVGKRKPRRCAMCGIVNMPSATRCDCGHVFDDEQHVETFLQGRLITGWLMVIGGFLLTILAALMIVFGIPGSGLPSVELFSRILAISLTGVCVALFVKGTRIVDATRSSLRDLRDIPRAHIVKRD